MVIHLGPYTFQECNLAFHFQRDNVYSPWISIGVYFTSPKLVYARYLKPYKKIGDQFKKAVADADSIWVCSGKEFLEKWRMAYQDTNSVIGPIINYCTSYTGRLSEVVHYLFTQYVGNTSLRAITTYVAMYVLKDRYFPDLFNPAPKQREISRALKEANLICLRE